MIRLMAPLLLLALLPAPSFSSRPIRGVSPSRQSLYSPIPHTSPPRWKCLNSPKEILFEAINDNYCDCEDGSDEPGTSACVGGAFWCANEGHVGAEIKSSRVGDGLCGQRSFSLYPTPLDSTPTLRARMLRRLRRAARRLPKRMRIHRCRIPKNAGSGSETTEDGIKDSVDLHCVRTKGEEAFGREYHKT
jgi:hypothetical protein